MSKAARQARRAQARHAAQHSAAVDAAAAATRCFERAWSSEENRLSAGFSALVGSTRRIRVLPDELHRVVRARRAEGWEWPSATYLPAALCGAAVIASIFDTAAIDRSRIAGPLIEQYSAHVGVEFATLLAWHRAPLVAVFDPDLAEALIDTPMSGDVPHDLLQRLPTWTVFIPTPWLRSSVGVFVSYDSGRVTRNGRPVHDEVMDDDLVLLFVVDDEDTVFVAFFRCSEPTVSASMESQFRDVAGRGAAALAANAGESELLAVDLFGQPYRRTIEEVLSLALYLCSEDPDVVSVPGRTTNASSPRTATLTFPNVVEVGFRIGAALRSGDGASRSADPAGGHHARPVPHVRSAHWHTYWYGPRSDPTARTARLRWIAPILINADADAVVPTARPIHPTQPTDNP